jgi:hypothetical protein
MPSRGSPNGPVTSVHSPIALVAIARNRWSSSIGTASRHQSEQVAAITRCAQFVRLLPIRSLQELSELCDTHDVHTKCHIPGMLTGFDVASERRAPRASGGHFHSPSNRRPATRV